MPFDEVEVITVNIPGDRGPAGPQGIPGPANVLTIGTVTTSAPGSAGAATISGVSPTQTLNFTIPQGPVGPTGPANTLTIGTVNTVNATTGASATITGTAPNQTLNLVVPRGYGVIPAGATGDVLVKNSATDYDTKWSTPTSAATASALIQRDSAGRAQVVDPSVAADIATKNYADTQDVAFRRVLTNQQSSTAYTFVLSDEGKVVYYNIDSSPVAYTIPLNANVAFPTGSWIDVYRGASGAVTITGAAGVTLRGPDGTSTVTLRGTYSKVRLTKSNADTWQASGDYVNVSTTATTNATASATVSTLVQRDAAGRAQVVDPSVAADISTKNYVDNKTWTSAKISDAASAATVSVVMKRDAAGRAQVVDPSVAADIATKNYVDTKLTSRTGTSTLDDSAGAVTDNILILKSPASFTGAFIKLNSGGTDYMTLTLSSTNEPIIYNPITSAVSSNNAVRVGNPNGSLRILPYNDGNVYIQSTLNGLQFTGLNGADGSGAVTFAYASAVFHGPIQSGGKVTNVTDPTAAQDAATKNYVDTKIAGTVVVLATGAAIPAGTPANTLIVRY
jgi:hypothetical protein